MLFAIVEGLLALLDLVISAVGWLRGDRRRRDGPAASKSSEPVPRDVR